MGEWYYAKHHKSRVLAVMLRTRPVPAWAWDVYIDDGDADGWPEDRYRREEKRDWWMRAPVVSVRCEALDGGSNSGGLRRRGRKGKKKGRLSRIRERILDREEEGVSLIGTAGRSLGISPAGDGAAPRARGRGVALGEGLPPWPVVLLRDEGIYGAVKRMFRRWRWMYVQRMWTTDIAVTVSVAMSVVFCSTACLILDMRIYLRPRGCAWANMPLKKTMLRRGLTWSYYVVACVRRQSFHPSTSW